MSLRRLSWPTELTLIFEVMFINIQIRKPRTNNWKPALGVNFAVQIMLKPSPTDKTPQQMKPMVRNFGSLMISTNSCNEIAWQIILTDTEPYPFFWFSVILEPPTGYLVLFGKMVLFAWGTITGHTIRFVRLNITIVIGHCTHTQGRCIRRFVALHCFGPQGHLGLQLLQNTETYNGWMNWSMHE